MTIVADEVRTAILSSHFTEAELRDIADLAREQAGHLAKIRARSLVPGDRVVITQTSPRYLIGLFATVQVVKPNKVSVIFEGGQDVGRFTGTVRVPPTCLEKV